jgi:hypothetical protein
MECTYPIQVPAFLMLLLSLFVSDDDGRDLTSLESILKLIAKKMNLGISSKLRLPIDLNSKRKNNNIHRDLWYRAVSSGVYVRIIDP